MKPVYIFFIIFCFSFTNYAQNKNNIKVNIDSIIQVVLSEKAKEISKDSITVSAKDSITNVWLTENWDTSVLNPYKREIVVQN